MKRRGVAVILAATPLAGMNSDAPPLAGPGPSDPGSPDPGPAGAGPAGAGGRPAAAGGRAGAELAERDRPGRRPDGLFQPAIRP
ncbi:hypothetical protein HMPREF0731_1479, partial [Pseudoroseomonas cervicalis ATCC 49957]